MIKDLEKLRLLQLVHEHLPELEARIEKHTSYPCADDYHPNGNAYNAAVDTAELQALGELLMDES